MKIFIITMDDPIQTNDFIKQIIDGRSSDIVGVAISKGDRLTLSKGKSKFAYVFSLFLIMGPYHFLKNSFMSVVHKVKKILSKLGLLKDPTILGYAKRMGIQAYNIGSPNSKFFLDLLSELKPDIIINQSQSIIKKELLSIPTIGVLNRHNALLPLNRGRLTPFWVLFKKETETGVSIHFLDEGIDSGPIVVQESYKIEPRDTFNTVVKRNYQIAPKAMLKAIDLLEQGFKDFIPNDDSKATYNSTPTLRGAWTYRLRRLRICK